MERKTFRRYPTALHIARVVCGTARSLYGGADKSLARPGKKQATATEDFEFHMSYLLS